PKDFGDRTLVWTLTTNGQSQSVAATLKPVWQIDRRRTTRGGNSERISSDLPPVVDIQPSSKTLERPGELTLAVSATDDGRRKRRGEPIGMTVMWQKYRGPGAVTFKEPQSPLPGGKSSTVVVFAEPGDYILQAVVDDGSGRASGNFGYHCCWTNVQVQV